MSKLFLSRRRVLALVAGVGSATALAVVPGTAASAAGAYVRPEPVCARSASGHSSCYAMKLVSVPRGTAGARLRTAVRPKLGTGYGPAGGYSPAQLATAYGLDVNAAAGATQTVAIVDAFAYPSARTDLNAFNARYGIPAETSTSFRVVGQDGGAPPVTVDSGWDVEQALDIQAVRATCRKCKIVLVEAEDNSNDNLAAAVNTAATTLHATVVSNSYGGVESAEELAAHGSAYNHPGVVITASTGDDGYFDWDHINDNSAGASGAANFPAGYNTVVAVGGTALYLNSTNSRAAETVWNENGPNDDNGYFRQARLGASGGGCSAVVNATNFQKNVSGYYGTRCDGDGTARRSGADIAADADPYTGFDIYSAALDSPSGWGTIGGTSLAAPLVAGMWALAGGAGGAVNPAISLYGHYKSTPSSVYDVTVGGNGACGGTSASSCLNSFGGNPNDGFGTVIDCQFAPTGDTIYARFTECNAATGFDGPSGVGTPRGVSVFTALKPTAVIAAPGTVTHGHAYTFNGSGSTDPFPGGSIRHYVWGFGDGTGSHEGAAKQAHTYAKAGSYQIRLTVTDVYGYTGTVTRTVTVH